MRFRKGRVSVSARGLTQAYLQAGAQSRKECAQERKGPILARLFRGLPLKTIGGVRLSLSIVSIAGLLFFFLPFIICPY